MWSLLGRPTLRDPEGEHELRPGDVVCFPEGPEGAHQIRNDTTEPIRVLIASTKSLPDAAVYPDSGKIGIWTGNDADPPRLFRIGTAVDYWDGETPENANDPGGSGSFAAAVRGVSVVRLNAVRRATCVLSQSSAAALRACIPNSAYPR